MEIHWLSRWLLPVPGVEGLARHMPELRTPAGQIALPIVWQIHIALGVVAILLVDPLGFGPALALQVAVVGGCFLLVDVIGIHGRERWLRRFGDDAFRYCFWGLFTPGLMGGFSAGMIHLGLVPGERVLGLVPGLLLGLPLLGIGLAISVRVYLQFGLDRFFYLYMFHPERGEMAHDEIFDHLRHPQYASFVYLFFGIVALKGSLESAALLVPFVLFAIGRILPEERELAARFGADYVAYRKGTPALLPPLSRWPGFLRYLVTAPIVRRTYED